MTDHATTDCPGCKKLGEQVEALKARVAELEGEVAKAKKDSGNSSKPPSSDIVKKPKPKKKGGGKRRRGGQPGHERHQREPFPQSEIDQWTTYYI